MTIIYTEDDLSKIKPFQDALSQAVNRKQYKKFGYDYSVSELINPPRQVQLRRRHPDKLIALEPVTALGATIGSGIHDQFDKLLRDLPKWEVERTMYCNIGKRRIKGRFDHLYDLTALYDLKTTSTWKAVYGDFNDWHTQLNMYYYMLGVDDVKVKEIWASVLYLDWSASEARKKHRDYPTSKTMAYQFKKESYKDVYKMFKDRIVVHAGSENLRDNELPHCTMEETWGKPDKWAVYKRKSTRGRANKLFTDEPTARSWATKHKMGTVEYRPGVRTRCERFCTARNICSQYQEFLTL